jgi:hypothetical protein
MLKTQAIELLGGSVTASAKAVGNSYQAVTKWPDVLPPRIADCVYAALSRRSLEELPNVPDTIAQEATKAVVPEPALVVEFGALRAGVIRRRVSRRAQEAVAERDRRAKGGPPFQSLETGMA